ncbi:hypothetical protein BDK51DRAFT_21057 [Blyttiomyces helicus]|uniref:SGNH hydrolase-type esterase domain-containing protein n=1 Tax=Blyttiomyces helicus TaxID=388810 RepID=A0A4P9WEI4_9FUNG|nr:hypothetical protein BDK51DRAFT_21057 [Blyttiomyces helicus]|eukprot:RKO89390.1 hypothetical protein BDK51DRAFT_21057 [Blyttiomyces helicus]
MTRRGTYSSSSLSSSILTDLWKWGKCNPCQGVATCSEFGPAEIRRSVAHAGSGVRLRRALQKMVGGQAVRMGVVGGESARWNGGVWDGAPGFFFGRLGIWSKLVFDHFNVTFPHPGNTLDSAAQPATDSIYHASCYDDHANLSEANIIFIELGINDAWRLPSTRSSETLVRRLLELPEQPAVVFLENFAPKSGVFGTGQDAHSIVASYYDIPIISVRDMLYFNLFTKSSDSVLSYFASDQQHPNERGHRLGAELVIHYIQQTLCGMAHDQAVTPPPHGLTSLSALRPEELSIVIPPVSLFSPRHSSATTRVARPRCYTMVSGSLKVVNSTGWSDYTYGKKKYLEATAVGASVTFSIKTEAGGVSITHLSSSQYGLGKAWCWVDNDEALGKLFNGWSPLNFSTATNHPLRTNVMPPGQHNLTCRIVQASDDLNGGHRFRIWGVATT